MFTGSNINAVLICRADYPSTYAYRKAYRRYRDMGWIVRRTESGCICFRFMRDYDVWKKQKE